MSNEQDPENPNAWSIFGRALMTPIHSLLDPPVHPISHFHHRIPHHFGIPPPRVPTSRPPSDWKPTPANSNWPENFPFEEKIPFKGVRLKIGGKIEPYKVPQSPNPPPPPAEPYTVPQSPSPPPPPAPVDPSGGGDDGFSFMDVGLVVAALLIEVFKTSLMNPTD